MKKQQQASRQQSTKELRLLLDQRTAELELKNRDLEIEESLEKVRARMLKMKRSEELEETCAIMYQQLDSLGVVPEGAAIYIAIIDTKTDTANQWIVTDKTLVRPPDGEIRTPLNEHPRLIETYEGWKRKDPVLIRDLSGAELEDFKDYLSSLPSFQESNSEFDQWPERFVWSEASFSNGTLGMIYITPLPEATLDILVRFSKVFDLTYTRFLDLQKAEAQAQKAQIEAALERIRAKTMGMHKSDELAELISQMNQEMHDLGVRHDHALMATDIDKACENKEAGLWLAVKDQTYSKKFKHQFDIKYSPIMSKVNSRVLNAIAKGIPFYTFKFIKEEKDQYFNDIFKYTDFKHIPQRNKDLILEAPHWVRSAVSLKYSSIFIDRFSTEQFTDEENSILKKFGKVFEQSYIRFLDLQKAEAQAREAQIEAALERVRSKAMAMHNSSDLPTTASIVFTELRKLGIRTMRSGISIQNRDNRKILLYTGTNLKDGNKLSLVGSAVLDNHPVLTEIYDRWIRGEDYFPVLKGDLLKSYYEQIAPNFTVPKEQTEVEQYGYFISYSNGIFYGWAAQPFTEDEKNILKRFASVVDLTFKRYFDLQRAERNVREAQIEAALERVRSKSLAMHHSDDLHEVIREVFVQLAGLNLQVDSSCIDIFDSESYDLNLWVATTGDDYPQKVRIPITNSVILKDYVKARKEQRKFLISNYSKRTKDAFFDYAFEHSDLKSASKKRKSYIYQCSSFTRTATISKHFSIWMMNYNNLPYTDQENEILKRFTTVFEQSYTRFLDLQKAEDQAKEAQIEASLERIRSRSMAMHESNELKEVIATVFDELQKLEFVVPACSLIFYEEDLSAQHWFTGFTEGAYPQSYMIPYIETPYYTDLLKAWRDGAEYEEFIMEGKPKVDYAKWLLTKTDFKKLPKEFVEGSGMRTPEPLYFADAYMKYGMLETIGHESLPKDKVDILKRIAKVFEQTYTRFLDLQKAEAQAREAQIEMALEKVRSRSLAMHNAQEMEQCAAVVFQQLEVLGIEPLRCGFAIAQSQNDKIFDLWSVTTSDEKKKVGVVGQIDAMGHSLVRAIRSAWKAKKSIFSYDISGKEMVDYFKYITKDFHLPEADTPVEALPKRLVYYHATFKHGTIYGAFFKPLPDRQIGILVRFVKVFEQTYIRFLDLQKAEAQARESQNEAALERVRAKAMAMHNPKDLVETASQLFIELNELSISFIRCGVLRILDSQQAEAYAYSVDESGSPTAVFGEFRLEGHEVMEGVFESWKHQRDYYYLMDKKSVQAYYSLLSQQLTLPIHSQPHHGYFYPFEEGGLYCFAEDKLNEETISILKKFTSIIALTYKRYFELQKAEKREKEAIKDASLDRVRAEIASMRSPKDLERITPLIWKELTALGVPFFRCGIFIIKEEEQMVHAYLSTPAGNSLAALHIGFGETEIGLIQPAIKNWRKQKIYSEEWDQARFIKNMKTFMRRGHIKSPQKYQAGETPPEKLVLQLVPFKQGMLYVGNSEPLISEHIELIREVANAFSIAYSRYEDFVQLDQAKSHIEQTLGELKSTQTQLIHAEKMASLGELTAGIAHEIQNPLNFVNNFSEVSADLIEELKEELAEGNNEEVKEISQDLLQNLEKINHHGQRASSIVKGMLEHSRTGTQTKELTDLNALADEYLRLAYHGLRAKDKSFNANFKTELDNSLPKVKVIAQDIGRVLLNMINNAFYAVSSKTLAIENSDFKPEVMIITKHNDKNVHIVIQDNGNGIPQKHVDKIFQPFFTTKPTGQGTGLGLSLSYDIIAQGHDGHLEVETEEGVGSRFIIEIPLTT